MQDSWVALDIAQPPLVAAQLKLRQLGTYVRADRDDLADAALEDIKRQLSPPFDVLASIGQYIIAEETEDAASLEESLAELERLIASLGFESLRPLITFGGGRLLEIRGDCEQAIISYKRALEMQPGDRGPNTSIGRCYRVLGDFEMAKSHLLTSITLDPFSPTVNLELARVYSDEGDRERALEHLSTALVVWSNADPEYEPARQARDMYAELGSN
jgi:tetratricopeptide (TPR) repeat protein